MTDFDVLAKVLNARAAGTPMPPQLGEVADALLTALAPAVEAVAEAMRTFKAIYSPLLEPPPTIWADPNTYRTGPYGE